MPSSKKKKRSKQGKKAVAAAAVQQNSNSSPRSIIAVPENGDQDGVSASRKKIMSVPFIPTKLHTKRQRAIPERDLRRG